MTRPREQAEQLAHGIEKLGGKGILFPLLEISPLTDKQPLRALIKRLHEFHLAIFISPNAVKYGMEAILEAGELPDTLQIATIGSSSAQALHEYGASKVIAPQHRFDSEALLSLAELQDVKNKHVLIFRGDKGRELLGETLKTRGAEVEYAACYQRGKPQLDISTLLASRPDILTISSSEALQNLCEVSRQEEIERIKAMPLFVTHPRIATAAHKRGWRNIITASGGDENLLAELTAWANLNKSALQTSPVTTQRNPEN